jgi:hypothetical protein
MPQFDDQLIPATRALIASFLAEIPAYSAYPLEEYLGVLESNPLIGAVAEVFSLLISQKWGEYTHEEPQIQEFITQQFERMTGALVDNVSAQSISFFLGNCLSQWGVEGSSRDFQLIGVQAISPTLYRYVVENGVVTSLRFYLGTSSPTLPLIGEDARFIHTVGGSHLSYGDPRGVPALRRVMPLDKAFRLVMSEYLISLQRQATPILVGFSDSGVDVPLLDQYGNPLRHANGQIQTVPAPAALLRQLVSVENRSVISTDLKNRVEAIAQQTNNEVFGQAIADIRQLTYSSLLCPETILNSTGVGDSNLNSGQRSTLGLITSAITLRIKERILDSLVRRLITWKFGDRVSSYGDFSVNLETQEDRESQLKGIVDSANAGILSPANQTVLNRVESILSLPLTEQINTPDSPQVIREFNLDYINNRYGS